MSNPETLKAVRVTSIEALEIIYREARKQKRSLANTAAFLITSSVKSDNTVGDEKNQQ